MKSALDGDETPFDAHLESVLPGVHHRLEVQSKQIQELAETVSAKTNYLAGLIKNEVAATGQATVRHLGRTMVQAGQSLLQGSDDDELSKHGRSSRLPENRPFAMVDFVTIYLPPKFASLPQLFNMWYGKGVYTERPYPGGLLALEETHKKKWRKHFSTAQNKQFTRAKVVMTALNERAVNEDLSPEAVCNDWEAIYKGEARLQLPRMVSWLQDQGFAPKAKARGKFA